MVKGAIHNEDIRILKISEPNYTAAIFIQQKLYEMQEDINNNKIMVLKGNLYTYLSGEMP